MIDKVQIKDCCLCGNCVEYCPANAIVFKKEFEIFKYPQIDLDKCIHCDLCENLCPSIQNLSQQPHVSSYIAKNKNLNVKKQSSSGGMFSVFAEFIIDNKGVVCGAAFDNSLKVKHIIVDNKKDLQKLRGSKYVQSDLGDCFLKIKQLLQTGQMVLFVGCPCQTAALRTYLKKDYPNQLYLVDFICHGMLSQSLFDDYIKYLEKKYKSRVVSFSFRDKTDGWIESGPKITFENGQTKYWPYYKDLYMQGLLKSLCVKTQCYICKYKNFYSGSDITLADYWGCEIHDPEFYDFYGVSAVVINNENGNLLFNNISNNIEYKDVDLENIVKYNSGLIKPFEEGKDRSLFMDKIKNGSTYIDALLDTEDKSNIILQLYREIKRKIRILKDKY